MSTSAQTVATETPTAEQLATQLSAARADGAKEMQARIQAIQTCDEAKGREKLASHLAFNTAMCPDEAKALLSASAVEAVQASAANQQTALAAGMAKVTNPQVGTEAQAEETNPQAEAAALWSRSNTKLRAVK